MKVYQLREILCELPDNIEVLVNGDDNIESVTTECEYVVKDDKVTENVKERCCLWTDS